MMLGYGGIVHGSVGYRAPPRLPGGDLWGKRQRRRTLEELAR